VLAGGRFSHYLEAVGRLIDSRWRWFGLLFLLLAFGMVVWGQTWLQPHLRGLGFVVYWLVCLGWTLLALITALVDAQAIRRQLRQKQADLLREALGGKCPGKADNERATNRNEGQRRQGSNSL
jgi:hypothetical protein